MTHLASRGNVPERGFRSVLVIDDSPLVRRLVRLAFEDDPAWQVYEADSGARGVELASREFPDAILLDVEMPGLSGPETLTLLRTAEATRGVPVLFLTALSAATDGSELLAAGADAVIAKPFDPTGLAAEVARVLGGRG
jgi:CheY-like chemotaxis protein